MTFCATTCGGSAAGAHPPTELLAAPQVYRLSQRAFLSDDASGERHRVTASFIKPEAGKEFVIGVNVEGKGERGIGKRKTVKAWREQPQHRAGVGS